MTNRACVAAPNTISDAWAGSSQPARASSPHRPVASKSERRTHSRRWAMSMPAEQKRTMPVGKQTSTSGISTLDTTAACAQIPYSASLSLLVSRGSSNSPRARSINTAAPYHTVSDFRSTFKSGPSECLGAQPPLSPGCGPQPEQDQAAASLARAHTPWRST